MTDIVEKMDVSTQTLLPRMSGDAFLEAYLKRETDNESLLKECTINERIILEQLHRLPETFQPEISIPPDEEIKNQGSFLLQQSSTLSSWRFDCDDWWNQFYSNQILNQQPYTITANRPSKSFRPLYESMMMLSPHTEIDWRRLLLSVDHLIQETKRYIDNIQQRRREKDQIPNERIKDAISAKKPKSSELNAGINLKDEFKLPSEQWLPIIEDLEKQLMPLPLNDHEPFDLEDYERFLQDNS